MSSRTRFSIPAFVWSPDALPHGERRKLLLGAASGALLTACGGGQDEESPVAPAASGSTGGDAPAAALSVATWEQQRNAALAPVLRELNLSSYRRPASLSASDLAKAVLASLDDGKPIKLLPGVTQLDSKLELVWRHKTKRQVTIFSDGNHRFTGSFPIHTDLPLFVCNCRFEQEESSQFTAIYVNGLQLWFNSFIDSNSRSVSLFPVSTDPGRNRIDLRWNDFRGHKFALYANDMNNSLIEHNRCRESAGRNFLCNGGYGNRFLNNVIDGGLTGISGGFHARLAPTPGTDPLAYNQSHLDTVIEGNVLSNITEEAIGFDAVRDPQLHPMFDQFKLARDGGTYYGKKGTPAQPHILVPLDSGTPERPGIGPIQVRDDLYRHYFVVWMTGPLAGKYAQIYHCSAHGSNLVAFSLRSPRNAENAVRAASDPNLRRGELTQEDFLNIRNNDHVNICAIAANFAIRNNTLHCRAFADRNTTTISMWGPCAGFEISSNRLINAGIEPGNLSHAGIRLTHVSGAPLKYRLEKVIEDGKEVTKKIPTPYGNYSHCTMPVALGRVENNLLGGWPLLLRNHAYAGAGGFLRYTYTAVVKGNSGCAGGGADIRDWIALGGAVIQPPLATYNRSSQYVSGNS